jgi:hypothetical protein
MKLGWLYVSSVYLTFPRIRRGSTVFVFMLENYFYFFIILDFFDVLISKINFLKYYFNVFSSNFFKKQPLSQF